MNFRTRNYKHEIRFDDSPRSVLNYTDQIWETLCGQIAAHDFNGLVLYPPEHPFPFFLSYLNGRKHPLSALADLVGRFLRNAPSALERSER